MLGHKREVSRVIPPQKSASRTNKKQLYSVSANIPSLVYEITHSPIAAVKNQRLEDLLKAGIMPSVLEDFSVK